MSDALWMKRGDALVPVDPATDAWLANVRQGEYVHTSQPRQPRNPRFHRLMMAILAKVVEHTWPRFANVGELMNYLKFKSGMVREVYIVEGVDKLVLESVSFASMDQVAFKALTDKWLAIVCEDLMPGTDPEELLKDQ